MMILKQFSRRYSISVGLTILFIFVSSYINVARANIGDTMNQCVARFGQPSRSVSLVDPSRLGGTMMYFKKNAYEFEEYLINNIVESESVVKVDGSTFTDREIEEVIKLEQLGATWSNPILENGQVMRLSPDGTGMAYSSANPSSIFIATKKILLLFHDRSMSISSFPSEKEVIQYITPGIDVSAVTQRFGLPQTRVPMKDGELLIYQAPPKKERLNYAYGGFEVFSKNNIVTDLEIIHITR